jgi:predicted phosphodiesterase
MRYLVLSDLHSNLEALHAVLRTAKGAYDEIVCCGDVVGYGPDPDAVVDWVREHAAFIVRGNHDKACSGVMEPEDFSDIARIAAYWTRSQMRPDNIDFLRTLPKGPRKVADRFAILHGSPRDEDEYVPAPWAAAGVFEFLSSRVSFFGHTHLQGGFVRRRQRIQTIPLKAVQPSRAVGSGKKARGMLEVQPDETFLINPGSVGQPRDRDNRAAFAIYDTDGIVEYGRAAYDIRTTMMKIIDAGLPDFLAYRLALGR